MARPTNPTAGEDGELPLGEEHAPDFAEPLGGDPARARKPPFVVEHRAALGERHRDDADEYAALFGVEHGDIGKPVGRDLERGCLSHAPEIASARW
jgi:hypothetical protein